MLIKTVDLGLQKSSRKFKKITPNFKRKTAALETTEKAKILTPRRKYLEKSRKELKEKEIVIDFRQNLKKVPHLPKVLPDSDTKQPKKKLANKFEERMRKRKEANYEDTIAIGRKQEEQEENEGRKSITPQPKSKEGGGRKEASSDKKWPKSTKILVDYFKKFENSSEQSGRKFENLGGRIKDSAGDYK